MEKENKRRTLILTIFAILTLLVLVGGATYAYFQAQAGTGGQADVNVKAGTTDNLTFSMQDIEAGVGNDHIKDEDNSLTTITINASETNFGKNGTSLGDGVEAKATLIANDTTGKASASYNVFFVMDNNSLVYTTSDNKPELIMKVTGPNGEIKEIDGLKYHDADPNNPNDVSGFDITGKEHAYAIKKDQIIQAVGANQQTEQIWKVEVILVNFPDQDQYKNTGLTITGNVVITTEEHKTYELAHINTITTLEPSDNSITATVELAKGATNDVEKYYFAIEKQDEVMTTAESEKTKDEVEGWVMEEGSTHTFNGLTPNTNYKIYSYVEDSEGFESSLYETPIVATKLVLPSITNVEVTNKTSDSITIKVTAEGSFDIKEYEYSIKKKTGTDAAKVETTTDSTHIFTELEEATEYIIEVRVKDIKDNWSPKYTPVNEITDELPWPRLSVSISIAGRSANYDVGEQVQFTIVVKNDGNVSLNNIHVTDNIPAIDQTIDTLDPGMSKTITASYIVIERDLEYGYIDFEGPRATAEDPQGGMIEARGNAILRVLTVAPNPELSVYMSAEPTVNVDLDDSITFIYTVTNSGNMTLDNIAIEDNKTKLNETITSLAPGLSNTFSISYTVTERDVENGYIDIGPYAEAEVPQGDMVHAYGDAIRVFTA